jgi:uncharacterized cupin superfamily protein
MHPVNITAPEFTYDAVDPPGFQAGMFRFGPLVGAAKLGASVYELPPGEALCPYHYEYAEEEWLLVLEGTPSVRTPEGVTELRPGDALCFRPGPDGAHQVRNDSAAVARVLMFSEVVTPAATVYPDSDKIGVWTGNTADDLMFRRTSAVAYYDGEGAAG